MPFDRLAGIVLHQLLLRAHLPLHLDVAGLILFVLAIHSRPLLSLRQCQRPNLLQDKTTPTSQKMKGKALD